MQITALNFCVLCCCCCCCVPILITASPPRTSAERIHGRGTGLYAARYDGLSYVIQQKCSPKAISPVLNIGVGRFRILGGAKGGPNSHQAHDVVMTSMRRNDVASTSFRRHVPNRFLINQCQIITFLILKYDIENSRIELRGIVLPCRWMHYWGYVAPLSNFWWGAYPPPPPPPPPVSHRKVRVQQQKVTWVRYNVQSLS